MIPKIKENLSSYKPSGPIAGLPQAAVLILLHETSEDLKSFEISAGKIFSDLKETFVYKEDAYAGVYIFNYEAEAIKAEVVAN